MEKIIRMQNIKMAFILKNLSQKDLAKILNFTPSYVSKLIKCERKNRLFDEWILKNLGI